MRKLIIKALMEISPLIDLLLLGPILASAYVMKFARSLGIGRLPRTRLLLQRVGVFPIRNHYYEPLFDTRQLRKSLRADRYLPGLDLNVEGQTAFIKSMNYKTELKEFPLNSDNKLQFHYNNPSFNPGDASFLYSFIRHTRPSVVIEIGSGNSTLIAHHAIERNRKEDKNYSCDHICIEPYEAAWLERLGLRVVRQPVETVDLDLFRKLEAGDLLFVDSSHIIRPQGDVLFEYLEVFSTLNTGVFIHIHDIFTPKDYSDDYVLRDVRFWNEQYLLEAFLYHNDAFEVIAALNYLYHDHYDELRRICYILDKKNEPGLILDREPRSFYIKKI